MESRLKAMYWYKPKKCYMTYSLDDYNKLSSWIMAGCDMDNMPFSGETPNSELEFELLFENATFEVMQTVGERNRNKEIKERQKQGRALTKKRKDREGLDMSNPLYHQILCICQLKLWCIYLPSFVMSIE